MTRPARALLALLAALGAAGCPGGGTTEPPVQRCTTAAECPGEDGECSARTCLDGVCGISFAAAGTPLADQIPGNCRVVACDGAGGAAPVPDDADVPDDGSACTADACAGGVPQLVPVAAGTACAEGDGTVCDGTGGCVACLVAEHCPGQDTACAARSCDGGVCSSRFAPRDTVVAPDVPGDCLDAAVCDGTGLVVRPGRFDDVLADGNACTRDACEYPCGSGGCGAEPVPVNPPEPPGAACAQSGGTVCDGAGACGTLVVSQVYAGGGADGAPWASDFVELRNVSAAEMRLAGWSVQVAPADGSAWAATPLSGAIPPGGFFLVAQAGGTAGAALPSPDASGDADLAEAAGIVALVPGTAQLAGCPAAAHDLVGYGAAACFEGAGPGPAPSAARSVHRRGAGCLDTGDSAADLELAAPAPRSTASQAAACGVAANETGAAAEADWCVVQFPASLTVGAGQATELVYGRIYETGVTEAPGPAAAVVGQLGYGPAGTDPRSSPAWTFVAATFNTQAGNDDEYRASLTAPAVGAWSYAYRFSLDGTASWTYCDTDGAGASPGLAFDPAALGAMTVLP